MDRFATSVVALPGCSATPIAGAVRRGERVYLSGANALGSDGKVIGLGDAAAQTNAALDQLEESLTAAGGSLKNLTKLTTCIVDRGFRSEIYGTIARRLAGVRPVSTGLVVPALPLPEMIVQIDAEAAIPVKPVAHVRPFTFEKWYGQDFSWEGCMAVSTGEEVFMRGQTGGRLDHSGSVGMGRTVADAAEQADMALSNLATILGEAGSSMEDVCKITVYISDRAYRAGVYPMIGKHFGDVRPVSTGIITTAFAKPEILFEIDVVAVKNGGRPHQRLRQYHSSNARYGTQSQNLDSKLCMIAIAGDRVILRGQTGMGLDEKLYGVGDAAAQAEQAMDNVATLLGESGCGLDDVAKATVYVTERDYLEPVNAAVLKRFGSSAPAFTTVIVKGLASPELLMEVDITAYRKGGAQ